MSNVLCLGGPAGYGKSTLTWFAMRDVRIRFPDASVVFYFCHFSRPCDNAEQVLRIIAIQLIEAYFSRGMPADETLHSQIKDAVHDLEKLQKVIEWLVKRMAPNPSFFFIDGIDEEQNVKHALTAIRFLTTLCTETPVISRLWCARRQHTDLVLFKNSTLPDYRDQHAHASLSIDIGRHTHEDVNKYLQERFSLLEARLAQYTNDSGDPSNNCVDGLMLEFARLKLMEKAKGNFLWAMLITRDFDSDEPSAITDIPARLNDLENQFPAGLESVYKKIFLSIKWDDRKVARYALQCSHFMPY